MKTPHDGLNRWKKIEWFIAASYFVVLSAVILVVHHYREPHLWENGGIAQQMWQGEGFSAQFTGRYQPTSWQAPGYPYLLLLAWKWIGQKPVAYLAISLLQALAVSSMLFPLRRLALRWFGEATVLPMTLVTLLMPLYAWYCTRLHHTALVMAVHPWLLWGWLTVAEEKRLARSVLVGLLTGVAGLFQPVMLAVYGVLAASRLVDQGRKNKFSAAGHVLLAGVLTLLVLVPWTIRNYQVHGRLLLVKNSFGKEFWMGNNPHATGTGYVEGGAGEITNVYPPRCAEKKSEYSEMQLMDAMQAEAMAYVKAEPQAFWQRTITKIAWFWTLTPAQYLRSTGGGEALGFRWMHAGYWFLFLALTIVSLLRNAWPKEYLLIMLLYIGFYSAVYGLTHVGQARFRGEIEFIFLPAVAEGLRFILGLVLKPKPTSPLGSTS